MAWQAETLWCARGRVRSCPRNVHFKRSLGIFYGSKRQVVAVGAVPNRKSQSRTERKSGKRSLLVHKKKDRQKACPLKTCLQEFYCSKPSCIIGNCSFALARVFNTIASA